MRSSLLVLALALIAAPAGLSGQDVEMLGERYGTRPPASYFDEVARDPDAFEFMRGRAARLRELMRAPGAAEALPAKVLGPRAGPVLGTVRIPVLLGLFNDSPDSVRFDKDTVQAAYFSPAPGSITAFYGELSGGRITLTGDLQDWTRATMTQAQATGGKSGLSAGLTGVFIKQLLAQHTDLDWGLYDNDGPDGVPNSGDDDGFVDALGVIHPTPGGECGGGESSNRIWSHRWNLRFAAGGAFVTGTPAAGGGFIRVDDYTVQPVFSCNGNDLNEIGVFSHELGHAFGLPDLYDTNQGNGKHQGAGNWDLMSSGSWGCNNGSPSTPCHMGAWSKVMLGWADVTTLANDADLGTLTLPPMETTGKVYRVDAGDGSGEYFLLENRQRIGFDRNLYAEGLLIWHIDPDFVAARWGGNAVNASEHRGVWLRQADGFDELGQPGGGRGDAGDPFPYGDQFRENRVFHAASRPAATSFFGTPTGLTLVDITKSGDDVSFRLLTRFTTLTIRSVGDDGSGGLFTVDGSPIAGVSHTLRSAPFLEHTVVAAAGEAIEAGVRRPFQAWSDDASAPAERTVVTPLTDAEFVAQYAGRELQLDIEITGARNGVAPGSFVAQPASDDLWFEEGTSVTVQAVAQTGFAFLEWTGALAGRPNPATVTMSAPVAAGATFEFTYAVSSAPVSFRAAEEQDLQFEVENGTSPVFWRLLDGVLPEGMTLTATGKLTGASLDMGSFPLRLEARDAIGLRALGEITLDVTAPEISLSRLTSMFLGVGDALDFHQTRFLDRQGNGDGGYDLGDLRAWVLTNPSLPLSAQIQALVGPRTILLKATSGSEGGHR